MESFELMGLADEFVAAGQKIAGVNLYGGEGPIAHADFGRRETRYPGVLGVPQDETERLLGERVVKLGVPVERNTELVRLSQRGSGVSAQLRKGGLIEEIEANWVMGCNGAHSAVLEQLAIPFSGSTYPEHFVLADIKVEGDVDHNEAQAWLVGGRRAGILSASRRSLAVDPHQFAVPAAPHQSITKGWWRSATGRDRSRI